MNYYELKITISPNTDVNRDVMAAILGEIGFESFSESEEGMNAYISEKLYDKEAIEDCILQFPIEGVTFGLVTTLIETQNWNEEWEKNFFQPIVIDNRCVVHSSFHQGVPVLPYDIVIDPKMAFGTGHHETTSLMLSFLLQADVENKAFLDMGCGTAVLAILAKMKGATPVTAIDIDEWAYNNSVENIRLNNTTGIDIRLGDAGLLGDTMYDVIFANINRNILLNDIPVYATCMKVGAELYMSGFYTEDVPAIVAACSTYNLKLKETKEKNNWTAVHFIMESV